MKTLIDKRYLNGIETLEYIALNPHKLIFLQHGIYSSKESVMNLIGVSLAKIGYHVVAIDAYKHGSRLEEPFLSKDEIACELDTMNVVKQTSIDIKMLYDKYFIKDYEMFDVIGISMGGLIAYYLSTITDSIENLVALISSPKFLKTAQHIFPKEKQKNREKESSLALEVVKEMDPSKKTMCFSKLIILNGRNDTVIPYQQSESFVNEHLDWNIVYKTYDTGHKISQEMHKDLLEMLDTFKEKPLS